MKKKKILFIIPIFGLIFISIVFFCDYTGMFKTDPDEQYAYKTVRTIQNELRDTEDKITYARQFYNDSVYAYQNKIEMFPSVIVANMFGFKPATFFEVDEADKQAPEVKF